MSPRLSLFWKRERRPDVDPSSRPDVSETEPWAPSVRLSVSLSDAVARPRPLTSGSTVSVSEGGSGSGYAHFAIGDASHGRHRQTGHHQRRTTLQINASHEGVSFPGDDLLSSPLLAGLYSSMYCTIACFLASPLQNSPELVSTGYGRGPQWEKPA